MFHKRTAVDCEIDIVFPGGEGKNPRYERCREIDVLRQQAKQSIFGLSNNLGDSLQLKKLLLGAVFLASYGFFLQCFIDGANHVECAFGRILPNSSFKILATSQCFFKGNRLPFFPDELFSNVKRLSEETL